MEGEPRGSELSREALELLKSPEQVFDSSKEAAEKEYRDFVERLRQIGKLRREGDRASLESQENVQHTATTIHIAWPRKGEAVSLLRLTPITEGHGIEQGIFGYKGEYGVGVKGHDAYEFTGLPLSLEKLFACPKNVQLFVKPTADRWAIDLRDEVQQLTHGESAVTLYMGMGFLLLGPEWMHVGMHEAGHIPRDAKDNYLMRGEPNDENAAWSIANQAYARIHVPHRQAIIEGSVHGRFDLLKNPVATPYGNTPSLGRIAQYGLTSHARLKGARLPAQWSGRVAEDTMRAFQGIISSADEAYEYYIGR